MYRPTYTQTMIEYLAENPGPEIAIQEGWSADDEREQTAVMLLKDRGYAPSEISKALGIPEDVVSFYWA